MAASNIAQRFSVLLQTQASANFAMVMSTGIVSIALHLLGYREAAQLLFAINSLLFVLLVILYPLRLLRYPRAFLADFTGHTTGPGFLTIVAGTCILGNQFVLLGNNAALAEGLFWVSVLLWIIILGGVFVCVFTCEPKPALEHGINGAWLVATVSTQAIVILGCILSPHMDWNKEAAFFCFIALFLLGFMLYLLVITMIFYRYCYKPLAPKDLSPTYWINAGAVAITTLAGAELITHAHESTLALAFLPFIKGVTVLAFATASFWIPLLFLLGIWRHVVRRYPFTYTAEYWGMVFPLGMYTACSVMLLKALDLPFLMPLPEKFLLIAVLAWIVTFVGMCVATTSALLHDKRA
ncbi:MAG: tellurite resistance/C4-dicarboxylate transporter family protein [Bilophila sp.]